MQKLILLALVLLLITPPIAIAQDDPPPYIDCGAEDYLIQRYYILQIGADNTTDWESKSEQQQLTIIANYMIASWEARDLFAEIDGDELPECVQELHRLTIQRYNLTTEYFTLILMANAIYSGGDFAVEAGRKDVRREIVDEQISDILIGLGWLTEDLELVNEPPPVE